MENLSQSQRSMRVAHSRSVSRVKSVFSTEPPNPTLKKRDYVIGICLLLIVVFLWTAANFITQDMFDEGFNKPFLVTWLNTSSFTLYLVPFLLRGVWSRWRRAEESESEPERPRGRGTNERQSLLDDSEDLYTASVAHSSPTTSLDSGADLPPLDVKETAQLAFIFCLFWFIANWTSNAALEYTSVTSTTILSSLSGFFTLIIGRIFHVEILTLVKLGAVITSFTGCLLVTTSDSHSTRSTTPPSGNLMTTLANEHPHAIAPILGDSLALISAIFYALYVTLLKIRIREESRIDMQLFFGFVGLVNILFLWPIGFILHFTGVERFQIPTTKGAVIAILINMFITLSSDFIYVLAMLKTTPLVVTIGLSLTIPLAVIGDLLFKRPVHGQVLLGAFMVIISFLAVGINSAQSTEKNDDAVSRSRARSPDEQGEGEE